MNLPNKLTVLRIFMIPLFLVFFFCPLIPHSYLWAFITFGIASLTDMLDGMLARKWNMLTDFGKLMDPLADKLLTIAAFAALLGTQPNQLRTAGLICLIVIISREFAVTSMRLVAAEKGLILAADQWGKFKTVSQMVWICQALLRLSLYGRPGDALSAQFVGWHLAVWNTFNIALFIVMMLLTVGSGMNYIVKNRGLFKQSA